MERPVAKRWWVWSVTREDAVMYRILGQRSQHAASEVRAGFTGVVMNDGSGVYDALARAGPGNDITLAHCWAHVRRKFIEAEPHYPAPCREVLAVIGQLYAVEREVPASMTIAADGAADLLALRRRLRDERSRTIIGQIHTWALAQRALPESSFGKALGYLRGLWPGLTRFLDGARIPLDNNRTERGLRGVVLGRKKSLRLALAARPRSRRALLQPHRVGEALRRRAEALLAGGDPRGARRSRCRHPAAHTPRLIDVTASPVISCDASWYNTADRGAMFGNLPETQPSSRIPAAATVIPNCVI
jgi:hypothetical protein